MGSSVALAAPSNDDKLALKNSLIAEYGEEIIEQQDALRKSGSKEDALALIKTIAKTDDVTVSVNSQFANGLFEATTSEGKTYYSYDIDDEGLITIYSVSRKDSKVLADTKEFKGISATDKVERQAELERQYGDNCKITVTEIPGKEATPAVYKAVTKYPKYLFN